MTSSPPPPADQPEGGTQERFRHLYELELRAASELRERSKSANASALAVERFALETEQSLEGAREQIDKLWALHRFSLRLHSQLEAPPIWEEALELLDSLVSATGIGAYVRDDGGLITCCARRGAPLLDLPDDGRQGPDILSWALRADNPGAFASPDECYLAVPVIANRRVVGAFALVRRTEKFDRFEIELAEAVGMLLAQRVEGATRYQEMEEQALTDGLTGVANYRYFRKQVDLEVARARRFPYPLGLLMADVDHFKKINDQLGHQAGDRALALTARAMQLAIRRSDVLARVGGEEFAVILPACDLDQARMVAEKLRLAVSSANGIGTAVAATRIPLTISVGGAALAGPELDAQQLIEQADAALFRAKRAGRNKSVMWSGPSPPTSSPAAVGE
ncbi:MAG TPA: sensor domain-containing diguanylate cyclase [Chloroflexota bacterium]|nr:sensor domain-containing diguanylate cyclase [Chloroflexota bacterium]